MGIFRGCHYTHSNVRHAMVSLTKQIGSIICSNSYLYRQKM